MSAEAIGARIAAAGFSPPPARAVVVDLADDPPLGMSARAIAVEEAARVVEGIGAAMVAVRAGRAVVAVRDVASQQAIEAALRVAGATTVEVKRVAPLWPSVGIDRDVGCPGAWVLDGEKLLDLESAAFGRPRAPRRVTVAGAVTRPGALSCAGPRSVEEWVAAAGGATTPAWAALDGGAFGGWLADPEAPACSSLLLVLPVEHALIARARTSIADHLRRVASACEGCRACTDSCPVFLDGRPLIAHEIVWALAQDLDAGTRPAASSACIGCGVCDAACPSALSPFALVSAVRARLPATVPPPSRGEPHPDREGRRMGIDLLLLRAGLAEFAATQ